MAYVDLSNNQFTGTLPPLWGVQGFFVYGGYNATQALTQLYVHNNRFTGTLPPEWAANGSYTALQRLNIGGNNFSATLPLGWGNATSALPALQTLLASQAGLRGSLPAWEAGLQSLQTM